MIFIKLWIDDCRPAPKGYVWLKSVNEAKHWIESIEFGYSATPNLPYYASLELIDIDHDAGDFYKLGGDYIKLLDWLEETGRNYPIRIHSQNPVGIQNMRAIIRHNGWKEIL